MSMLAEALRAYGAQSDGSRESGPSDRDAYLAYAEACMMAGKQPMPYPQWVAAGKPSK